MWGGGVAWPDSSLSLSSGPDGRKGHGVMIRDGIQMCAEPTENQPSGTHLVQQTHMN